MLIGACGIACGVCKLREEGACEMGGCVAGTNERISEKQKRAMAELGIICDSLACAAKKKIDYCFKCDEFPCKIYYGQTMPEKYASPGIKYKPFPFSKEFLDRFKHEEKE